MTKTGYLILAICLLAFLLIVFVVSFVLYVKQPAPKGCEHLGVDESKCSDCSEAGCRFYSRHTHTKEGGK